MSRSQGTDLPRGGGAPEGDDQASRRGHGLSLDRRSPVAPMVAVAGAAWGVVAFAVLWGYTSIVVTRRFVDSVPGLLTLLPVRIVLEGIHVAEGLAGHPFDFSRNHDWIGVVSAGVGALVLLIPFLVMRRALGGRRRSR